LVSPSGGPERDLERVRRLYDEKYEAPKRILELNRSNPLISGLAHRLSAAPADPTINLVIEQLYDSARLQEGLLPNPAEMVGRIQQLMEAAVAPRGAEKAGTADGAADAGSGARDQAEAGETEAAPAQEPEPAGGPAES
jgi:hypothetical protein